MAIQTMIPDDDSELDSRVDWLVDPRLGYIVGQWFKPSFYCLDPNLAGHFSWCFPEFSTFFWFKQYIKHDQTINSILTVY